MDHPAADDVADRVLGQLVAIENADHAGHLLGFGRIDALDLRMCVRRADEMGLLHARHNHIVGVFALAGDEPLVFLARHAGADAFHSHVSNSSGWVLEKSRCGLFRPGCRTVI